MATLTVDLQDGFSEDRVRVTIDGVTAVEFEGVSTDYSIGRAASAAVEVLAGAHTIEVVLLDRQLSASRGLQIEGQAYLGISIIDSDRVGFRESGEPFIYY